jgi:hypothetical protein
MAANIDKCYQGAKVRLWGEFRDGDEAFADPTNVFVSIRYPGGTKVKTYQYGVGADVVKDSTGNYYIELDTTSYPGTVYYSWTSTGTGQAATEESLVVLPRKAIT